MDALPGGRTLGISFGVDEGGGRVINFRVRLGDADSHARWEQVDLVRNGTTEVDLMKLEWSRGDPDNIQSCREELFSTLEVDRTLRTVCVDHYFFGKT